MSLKKHPPGDPMTLGKLWHSQLVHVAVVCVPILVSGCAETDLLSPVAPGKYDFLDCPSITKRLARTLYQEANLARLMSRASEGGPQGAVVNAIAYQDQYNTARAELRELRKAGEVKKCSPSEMNPPPAAPPE